MKPAISAPVVRIALEPSGISLSLIVGLKPLLKVASQFLISFKQTNISYLEIGYQFKAGQFRNKGLVIRDWGCFNFPVPSP